MKYVNFSFPTFLLILIVGFVVGPACKKAPPPPRPAPISVAPKKAAPAEEAQTETEDPLAVFGYKASERNPFNSLLKVKKTVEEGVPDSELTPLQKIPVADMTVQSIIVSRKKSLAHVITPDGKAHIVTVGTLLGRHKGKIVRMSWDEIVIEEQFEDYLGKAFKQETVLRLREKEGENL